MKKHRTLCLLSLLACVGMCVDRAAMAQSQVDEVRPLKIGPPLERELSPKEDHIYEINLTRSQVLRAVVDQRGIAVRIYVFGPAGQRFGPFVSRPPGQGFLPVTIDAKETGPYFMHVRPFDEKSSPGHYRVRIEQVLTGDEAAAWMSNKKRGEAATVELVKNWLITNAIPISTVEAGHGFADLEPLKAMIGAARVVALGEANHGTREFAQFKHRLLEFLVTEMGFTGFAIEATMPEAFDVNKYVLTGEGDPAQALAGLYFWISDTKEMLETIQWMRRYNANPRHEKKVQFYGFDLQYPTRAARVTLNFFQRVDPDQASKSGKTLASLANPFTGSDFRMSSKEAKEELLASVKVLIARLNERKEDYCKRSSQAEHAAAMQHAKILAQNIELFGGGSTSGGELRDRFMAENVGWILEHQGNGTKLVVSAHNGHIAGLAPAFSGSGSMGAHLRRMLGSEVVTVGFIANQGSFQAIQRGFPSLLGQRIFTIGPAPESTLEGVVSKAAIPLAIIDLHATAQNASVAEWFSSPHRTRAGGAVYTPEWATNLFASVTPTGFYDSLFFLEKMNPTHPAKGGDRPGDEFLPAPSNLDFERADASQLPLDWIVPPGIPNFVYRVAVDETNPHGGRQSAVIRTLPGQPTDLAFGSLHQQVDAAAYRGQRIKLRAFVRTDVKGTSNQAHLWLRVWQPRDGSGIAKGFYENMADNPIRLNEWREYEIEGNVARDAVLIDYGLALVGEGRAWLDDVTIAFTDQ